MKIRASEACPKCGDNTNMETIETMVIENNVDLTIECHGCGYSWVDTYSYIYSIDKETGSEI